MKKTLLICLSSLSLLGTTLANDLNPSNPNPIFDVFASLCKKVTLNSGTPILLESNEKLETHNLTVGQTIIFKVKMDVKAEGETVIATGALAIGSVKFIEESTFNNPAEIRVDLKYVQAVDGQQVPLNGNELSAFGKERGRGTGSTIVFGTGITAHVTNNIDIKSN